MCKEFGVASNMNHQNQQYISTYITSQPLFLNYLCTVVQS